MAPTATPVLKAATYLSPSIPVEYYESLLHYLEAKLGIHTTLLYESRWEGPRENRQDPFSSGAVDLAWMSSTVFLRMLKEKKSPVELLPVSSVHLHPRGEDKPGYFADIIMHKDFSEKVKEFIDLRGCKWAYNTMESLSGHSITLQKLKSFGENSSFFGNVLYSGSHLDTIKMVIAKKVDAAAVDANCRALFLDHNSHLKEELVVLESWGMLPPYPIVVNSNLSADMKKKIANCLLNMHQDIDGLKKLSEFRVRRFARISLADFDQEEMMVDQIKDLKFGSTYY